VDRRSVSISSCGIEHCERTVIALTMWGCASPPPPRQLHTNMSFSVSLLFVSCRFDVFEGNSLLLFSLWCMF
jgi:hypothetical protein